MNTEVNLFFCPVDKKINSPHNEWFVLKNGLVCAQFSPKFLHGT